MRDYRPLPTMTAEEMKQEYAEIATRLLRRGVSPRKLTNFALANRRELPRNVLGSIRQLEAEIERRIK